MASPLGQAILQAQAAGTPGPPNIATVAPTNFTQANSDYNSAMEAQYAAKLGQQNALWGGLAGLGSAGILAGGKYLASPAAASATPGFSSLVGNASGGTAAAPIAGLDASDYGAGATLADQFGMGAGAADAGATAAASSGGSDALAALLALFA